MLDELNGENKIRDSLKGVVGNEKTATKLASEINTLLAKADDEKSASTVDWLITSLPDITRLPSWLFTLGQQDASEKSVEEKEVEFRVEMLKKNAVLEKQLGDVTEAIVSAMKEEASEMNIWESSYEDFKTQVFDEDLLR